MVDTHQTFPLPSSRQAVEDYHRPVGRIARVGAFVAEQRGIPWALLKRRQLTWDDARERHLAIWVARAATEATLVQIGRVFRCSHCTVLHAIARIETRCSEDAAFDALANDLVRRAPR